MGLGLLGRHPVVSQSKIAAVLVSFRGQNVRNVGMVLLNTASSTSVGFLRVNGRISI